MPAESAVPPVTFGVKVTNQTPAHVTFELFAGRNDHARGHAGGYTLRRDEFEELLRRLEPAVSFAARETRCCNQPNYVWEHSRGSKDYFRCHSCGGGMTKPRRVQDHEAGSENTDG